MTEKQIRHDQIKQLPIVYRGGHHVIHCNGKHHWIDSEDYGLRYDGRCWCSDRPQRQAGK
jgi:hypothetical protein